MAFSDASQDSVEQSLLEKGFHSWEDASAGDRVSEMERRGFPYFTPYGLDFCADFAFDTRIKSTLEALFETCILAHWLRYEEYPNHIECFRRGGQKAGRRVFVVQVWSKGSKVDYYAGSHIHNLDTKSGLRSVFEIPLSELSRVGCEADAKEFPDGALVILDARLCFEIKKGYAITFMFATEDVVIRWPKIDLPNSTILLEKVASLEKESHKIRLNFAFQDKNDMKDNE